MPEAPAEPVGTARPAAPDRMRAGYADPAGRPDHGDPGDPGDLGGPVRRTGPDTALPPEPAPAAAAESTVPPPAAPAAGLAESTVPDDPDADDLGAVDPPTAGAMSRARPAAHGGDHPGTGDSTVPENGRRDVDRPDTAPLVSERALVTPAPLPGRYEMTGTAEADPYPHSDRDIRPPGHEPGPPLQWRPPAGPGGAGKAPELTASPASGGGPPPGVDGPMWSAPDAAGYPAGPAAVPGDRPGDRPGVTFADGTPPDRPEPDVGDLDPMALDRLSRQLYGRLRGEFAADLLVDRERAQLLTDLI